MGYIYTGKQAILHIFLEGIKPSAFPVVTHLFLIFLNMNMYKEHLKSGICVLNILQFAICFSWKFSNQFWFAFFLDMYICSTKIELFCKIFKQKHHWHYDFDCCKYIYYVC